MSQQQVDLETFQFILSQFSEDIAEDCSKIIAKLLKSLSASMSNESKICDRKVFASVKVLLNLYEYLNGNNANTKSKLPINIILENLKLFLKCNNETCSLPENDVQLDLLSIIASVFKNELLQKSSKDQEELVVFYDYIFISIGTTIAKKECKSDCLIFKLKILTLIYELLAKIGLESCNDKFYEKIKSVNNPEESHFLTDLTLHEDDGVAFQTLFYLIPAQTNCFQNCSVMEIIWKQISASIRCDNKCSRVLVILCQVFDICFNKSLLTDKLDSNTLPFEDLNFWKLIQFALKDVDPIKRKQGLYLFKKAIDVLNTANRNIICDNNKYIFYWPLDSKIELYKVYSQIILILEFLEEQQIHIIRPIFKLVDTVTENVLSSNKVNFSWILVIYEKALLHESLQVVKWGLSSLLLLHENFFLDEDITGKVAELLATTLNNLSIYFNNGLALRNELKIFFKKIANLSTGKMFFSMFIRKVCSQVWSAEALFFVINSLTDSYSESEKFPFWGKEEISEITTFVSKAFKTHNKIIRTAVQTQLLDACLQFTDMKDVGFESFISLISLLFEREILKIKSEKWYNTVFWLKKTYSKENAYNILRKHVMEKSINKPKYVSLMFILFYDMFDLALSEWDLNPVSDLESQDGNVFVLNCFQEILLSFNEIHKRPYCNKQMYDENLLIICKIYQSDLKNSVPKFIKGTLPFLKDVLSYIQTQLSQISGLEDFADLELYLNSFKVIIKILILFKFDIECVNCLYIEILKDLESSLLSDSNMCSVGIFWRIKLLNILLELNFLEPKSSFLNSYLLKAVNKALKKDDNFADKTRNLHTLWGRLNSEFLEQKWKIFQYLIDNNLVLHGSMKNENSCWISNDDLAELCVEALNTGGYEVLCPVMFVLKNLLPVMEKEVEVKKIIDAVWKLILERNKTEEFKVFIRKFVEMIFQEAFIDKGEPAIEILLEYVDLIFSDSSLAVVNIFMKHVQQVEITKSLPLFCFVIGKGLIFGPVEKKDERLTKTVCFHIEFTKICNVQEIDDYNTSNEIRARAVQKILQLDKKIPMHQTIARQLIVTLLEMENKLNKNRTRYFGNSHVHRVKHRLMQALLLLEPMLNENEDQVIQLSKWVIHGLVSENSQPSVRYMQEWLLIRMNIRHSEIYSVFNISNYYNDSEENKKGVCSLIGVMYHVSRFIRSDLVEQNVTFALPDILNFCFHRHFELRLYAQVAFVNYYHNFAKLKGWNKLIQQYESVYDALRECFEVESKRNKNLLKLINSFYFKDFHPLNNYSLETIYKDLPRLADVGSEEWISSKIFEYCGVKSSEIAVPLKDSSGSLKFITGDTWSLRTFEYHNMEFDDQKAENFLDNYQKKIIPLKPLIPGWNENNSCQSTFKKDGLIVVASLIDRLPNLGGLARTCEVFGASEYIINSLKHLEDEQFTSLSVTAEKWITVKEVKSQNLLKYVSEMKQNGYTIVGAEQALHSQPLNAVKFPKKSLLLLGNEKEGIPPNLLPFLDICIEIPQLGLIRSLNVHVTGALCIWEYAKHHHFM